MYGTGAAGVIVYTVSHRTYTFVGNISDVGIARPFTLLQRAFLFYLFLFLFLFFRLIFPLHFLFRHESVFIDTRRVFHPLLFLLVVPSTLFKYVVHIDYTRYNRSTTHMCRIKRTLCALPLNETTLLSLSQLMCASISYFMFALSPSICIHHVRSVFHCFTSLLVFFSIKVFSDKKIKKNNKSERKATTRVACIQLISLITVKATNNIPWCLHEESQC